jgi:hypothetical protein
MGLYLRKAFRAGPIRLNLSKSGLGISGGITGARVGIGPRGTYVHAGRKGLYYRKHMSSGRKQTHGAAGGEGCATVLFVVVCVVLGLLLLSWLVQNPLVMAAGAAIAISIPVARWWYKVHRTQLIRAYKELLDTAFVTSESPPSSAVLDEIKRRQQRLRGNNSSRRSVDKIEADVYQALLDKVLDDQLITNVEATTIAAAEQTLQLDQVTRLRTKKEIFSAAYLEAIADHEITPDELNRLRNLLAGLRIPRWEVQREHETVREIVEAQGLRLPLTPILSDQLAAPIQKSEDAFYQCSAQVLSRRKSKQSPTGYDYSVRREGTAMVTNKRVLVVGDETTSIRFSEIIDLEVDIDEGLIEILKVGSGRPMLLKLNAPIYTGRIIDLLMNAQARSIVT